VCAFSACQAKNFFNHHHISAMLLRPLTTQQNSTSISTNKHITAMSSDTTVTSGVLETFQFTQLKTLTTTRKLHILDSHYERSMNYTTNNNI